MSSTRIGSGALVLVAALAACGSGGGGAEDAVVPASPTPTAVADPVVEPPEPSPPTPDVAPTEPAPGSSPTTEPAEPEPDPTAVTVPAALDLRLTPLLSIDRPIAMATLAGASNVFVATKGGRVVEVRIADDDATIERELIDISAAIADGAETGLLGLTFSPDGDQLYLMFSDRSGDNRLVEFAFSGEALDLGDARPLLSVTQPRANHNGGAIAFGPDGYLYVALGDGGGGGDPFGNGQNVDTLLGSILRIDPTPDGPGTPYTIPADNPFANGGGRPEIFISGVRNPWRFSFDRATGDLWVADVGQGAVEEVDVLYASQGGGNGVNLGWNLVEGNQAFAASGPPAENYVPPIYEYGREDGCSITGGYVYRGTAIADLTGRYVFGDYCSGLMWGLASSQAQGSVERFDLGVVVGGRGLVSFGEGPDGELYVLSFDNTIYRLDPG